MRIIFNSRITLRRTRTDRPKERNSCDRGARSMLTCSRVAAGVVLCAVVAAPPAMAQDEAALKSYFEGHRVTVRIDMPGTQEGVDVHVDSAHPLDFSDYRDDLKKYGVALHAGQSATVTLVKVKKDLIE